MSSLAISLVFSHLTRMKAEHVGVTLSFCMCCTNAAAVVLPASAFDRRILWLHCISGTNVARFTLLHSSDNWSYTLPWRLSIHERGFIVWPTVYKVGGNRLKVTLNSRFHVNVSVTIIILIVLIIKLNPFCTFTQVKLWMQNLNLDFYTVILVHFELNNKTLYCRMTQFSAFFIGSTSLESVLRCDDSTVKV